MDMLELVIKYWEEPSSLGLFLKLPITRAAQRKRPGQIGPYHYFLQQIHPLLSSWAVTGQGAFKAAATQRLAEGFLPQSLRGGGSTACSQLGGHLLGVLLEHSTCC